MLRPAICCWKVGCGRIASAETTLAEDRFRKGHEQLGHLGRLDGKQMVGDRVLEKLEPECGDLREDPALVGNAGAEHVVECRDAVRRHKQQVVAQGVDVAHLAPRDQRKAAEMGVRSASAHSKTVPPSDR